MAAGRAAGLNVVRTINEPTAAAIAYRQGHPELAGKVLVYDLGGGTFDVSVVDYAQATDAVLSSEGNHELGGVLWDDRLMTLVAARCQAQFGADPFDDPDAFAALRPECEEAKKALTSRETVKVFVNAGGGRRGIDVTRKEFEEATADLLDQTRVLCAQALARAGLVWPDLSHSLLVGGSSRMPMVASLLRALTRKAPLADLDPDVCVAVGAALSHLDHAAPPPGLPARRRTVDVTPHGLGYVAISSDGGRFVNDVILAKNLPIPLSCANPATLKTTPGEPFELDIFLLQGESPRVMDNRVLGHYVAAGGADLAEMALDVGFEYDLSGMVKVACRNRTTGEDYPVSLRDEGVDLSWTDLSPEEHFIKTTMCVVFLLDTSSSMSTANVREAVDAAKGFMRDLPRDMPIGLATFGAGGVVRNCDITPEHAAVERALDALHPGGGTPMAEGLAEAAAMLVGRAGARTLVVLTDGGPNNADAALAQGERMKSEGVVIHAIGTTGADEAFLKKLASGPSHGVLIGQGEVGRTFGRIAKTISTQVGGLVGFGP